jgi:hypothetical protein
VFLVAVPIAALAFLATWLIPQVELQQWTDPGPGAAQPDLTVAASGQRRRDRPTRRPS